MTWRLARQLVAEHDIQVRLWVDDLAPFCRLCPDANDTEALQFHQGVELHHWPLEWQPVEAADMVIEAFACQLPTSYIESMVQREKPSLWLNLEYLSAEPWVEGCHGLPSLQSKGLQKFFFFPGFTPKTGGLLRETGLIEQRRRFQQDAAAQQLFLSELGISPLADALLISLFGYENPSLASWLDSLSRGPQASHLLVPEGRIIAELRQWLNLDVLAAGDIQIRGALTVQVLPFISQDAYDRLLWCCDFNAVRGEDSFIRAQWAGRPFLWQIYPQQENTHLDKLEAFLSLYNQDLPPAASRALLSLWRGWNEGKPVDTHWSSLREQWPAINEHAEHWCRQQSSQTNIAAALVQFYLNWL